MAVFELTLTRKITTKIIVSAESRAALSKAAGRHDAEDFGSPAEDEDYEIAPADGKEPEYAVVEGKIVEADEEEEDDDDDESAAADDAGEEGEEVADAGPLPGPVLYALGGR